MKKMVILAVMFFVCVCSVNAEMVAHWKLDGSADDETGAHNGQVMGNPQFTAGVFGQALRLDGVGDYIQGSDSSFDFENTTFSFAAWFKTDSGNSIIFSEDGYYAGWNIALEVNGQVKVQFKNSSLDGYIGKTNDSYTDGQWHHITANITTSTTNPNDNHADLYIDAGLVYVNEFTGDTYDASDNDWRIGARVGGTYFDGCLDDIRIYDHALSQQEINAIVPEPATLILFSLGAILASKKGKGKNIVK